MKKRTLKERKEEFKKAYYAGLKEQGLIDPVEEVTEKTNEDLSTKSEQTVKKTKKELIAEAEELGLKANEKMTKAQIIELIKEAQNG